MPDKYLVKNTMWTAQVINLPDNKSVTLPARGSGTMSEGDLREPVCQKLLAEGKIIVLGTAPDDGAP